MGGFHELGSTGYGVYLATLEGALHKGSVNGATVCYRKNFGNGTFTMKF